MGPAAALKLASVSGSSDARIVIEASITPLYALYSLSFLFLLFGVGKYSLPEVLIAGCAGALVQSKKSLSTRFQTAYLADRFGRLGNVTT